MEYKEGARVYLANGDEIGRLSRVVIDPRTMQISDIVISHGALQKEERIAAATLVDYASEDEIHLKEIANGWDELEPFEEVSYRLMDENAAMAAGSADNVTTPVLYSFPPTVPVTGGMVAPGGLVSPAPYVPQDQASSYRKETTRNVPEGSVTLNEGARVVSQDGAELGKVEKLFTRPETGLVSHFVISRGLLLKERKLVPFDWVDLISDSEVRLGVSGRFVEHLPDYNEQ